MSASRVVMVVEQGRDNALDVEILEDGAKKDISALSTVELAFNDSANTVVSSGVSGVIFDWTSRFGVLVMTLGDVTAVKALTPGDYDCTLRLMDPTNPLGVVWAGPYRNQQMRLTVGPG